MFTDKFLFAVRPVRRAFLRFLAAVDYGRQFREVESEFVVVKSSVCKGCKPENSLDNSSPRI